MTRLIKIPSSKEKLPILESEKRTAKSDCSAVQPKKNKKLEKSSLRELVSQSDRANHVHTLPK